MYVCMYTILFWPSIVYFFFFFNIFNNHIRLDHNRCDAFLFSLLSVECCIEKSAYVFGWLKTNIQTKNWRSCNTLEIFLLLLLLFLFLYKLCIFIIFKYNFRLFTILHKIFRFLFGKFCFDKIKITTHVLPMKRFHWNNFCFRNYFLTKILKMLLNWIRKFMKYITNYNLLLAKTSVV